MSFTQVNHYVPQWYQRRFLSDCVEEKKLFYLDLKPERIAHSDGGHHYRTQCRRLGPVSCFYDLNLYTLFFKEKASDVIEKNFFGRIDSFGALATEFFREYIFNDKTENAILGLVPYLGAQKFRTPKGLDYLKARTPGGSHQQALILMGKLIHHYATIWTEGVWEVLNCDDSPTQFILSDNPVTTFNKDLPPESLLCTYPLDAPVELLGSHTVFPLAPNRCLVITNLGYVRNPAINRLQERTNPRYSSSTIFDMRMVQTGRKVFEDEVRAINFIIKARSRKYIAAPVKDWLFPEKFLKTTKWNELGGDFFLMPDPRKIHFTSGIFAGVDSGPSWASDEYGRFPNDNDSRIAAERDLEWKSFQKHKKAWDDRYGPVPPEEMHKFF